MLVDREPEITTRGGGFLTPAQICELDDRLRNLGLFPYATALMRRGVIKLIIPINKELIIPINKEESQELTEESQELTTHEGLVRHLNALIADINYQFS